MGLSKLRTVAEKEKICGTCSIPKSITQFRFKYHNRLNIPVYESICNSCTRIRKSLNQRELNQQDPNRHKAAKERRELKRSLFRKNNPDLVKKIDRENYIKRKQKLEDVRLFKTYGLTPDKWKGLYEEQNGLCKICNVPQEKLTRKFHVDHCHSTGKIRGLLCGSCNQGLGYYKEDIQLFQKAIDYLKENYHG